MKNEMKNEYSIDFEERLKNYNKNIEKLGKKANDERIANNLTFIEIAKNCNMSKTTVSDFLQNRTKPNIVTVSTVIKSISDLVTKKELAK